MNGIKIAKGFNTTDGAFHDNRLKALVAQQAIDLRAIVQSDEKYGKSTNLTSSQIAELIGRNGAEIAKVNTYYKTAINRERTKPAPLTT